MSTPYRTIRLDLATLAAGIVHQLVGTGAGITSFTFTRWPGGDGFVKLGPSGDEIAIDETLEWTFDPCEGPEQQGLYLKLPLALAGTMEVVVFFGGGSASIGA